jgi:tetratricopeptide (TPR) repeat protein
MSISSSLREHLLKLESADFIQTFGNAPDRTYTFRHALQHDAAYASLLKQHRRDLHRSVGMALERLFPDQLAELAPELANHFAEAGDTARALNYSARAAERAAANYANAEALMHFDRALALAENQVAGTEVLARLVRGRGRVLQFSGLPEAAFAAYQRLEALALAQHDLPLELDALLLLAEMRSSPTALLDLEAGQVLCDRALALAGQLHDRAAEARIWWNLMLMHTLYGQAQHGVVYGERSLAIARELGLREQTAYSLNDLARGYANSGQRPRAMELLREVEPLWRELGNLPMLADCLATLADAQVSAGQFDEGLTSVARAIEVSRMSGNWWNEAYAAGSRGRVLMLRGGYHQIFDETEQIIRLSHKAALVILEPLIDMDLARVYAMLGDYTRAHRLCETALALAAALPPAMKCTILSVRARIYTLQGNLAAAEADLSAVQNSCDSTDYTTDMPVYVAQAHADLVLAQGNPGAVIEMLERVIADILRMGTRYYLPQLLHALGLVRLAQGRHDGAEEALSHARSEAEAMRADVVLWPILAALAVLAERRGNITEAIKLRMQAHVLVTQLAASLTEDALRASFLSQAAAALEG